MFLMVAFLIAAQQVARPFSDLNATALPVKAAVPKLSVTMMALTSAWIFCANSALLILTNQSMRQPFCISATVSILPATIQAGVTGMSSTDATKFVVSCNSVGLL